MAELEAQMELAEREVAEAVEEYRENRGELKEDVRRRIEDARHELERARQKLEELHAAEFQEAAAAEEEKVYMAERERTEKVRRQYDRSTARAYSESRKSSNSDTERIRIRVNGETLVDHDHRDYDYDVDVDIDIDEEEIEEILENLGETIERMGNAWDETSDVRSVGSDELRDLFHSEIAGMERTNINSDRSGGFGISITTVEARYRGQRTDLELTVVDLGSLSGIAREGMDMIDAEFDSESDGEYVRSDRIDGYPAKIHFEQGRRHDELGVAVFVGDRFVVAMKAEGTDLTEELIEDVFDDFDLDDLADLE